MSGPFRSAEDMQAYLGRLQDPQRRAQAARNLGLADKPASPHTRKPAPKADAPLAPATLERPLTVRLPFPPSTNSIWRSIAVLIGGEPRVRVLLSERGRAYRRRVRELMTGYGRVPLGQELAVAVHLCPPDRKKRDIDNNLKALFDALTHAHFWRDDSLVAELHVYRHPPRKGEAHVALTIWARPEREASLPNPGDEHALDQCQRGVL